jgi:hypothetical protein
LIGLVITVVCLGLAFRQVDLGAVWSALRGVDPVVVVISGACTLTGYVIRAVRWHVILAERSSCSIWALFRILMIGFATNNLLPARLGEVARAVLLAQAIAVRKSFALASIFLERLFDGLALVAILGVISASVDLPAWGRDVERLASLVFLGTAVAIALVFIWRQQARSVFLAVLHRLPHRYSGWGRGAARAFLGGLDIVRRPQVLVTTVFLSAVVWTLEWASYYVMSHAFDIRLSTSERIFACALLLAVVNLGIMLPSSPGYVGTFQFFGVEALKVFEIPADVALAFTIVAHLTQYALVTIIGSVFASQQHVSFAELVRGRRDELEGTEESSG